MNNSGDLIFRSPTKQFQTLNLCPMNPHMNALSHFFLWWRGYFNAKREEVNLDTLFFDLISAFKLLQHKKKKEKGTHIREIQAFQKYFETVYDPSQLSRTVYNAAKTLKEKLFEKFQNWNFLLRLTTNIYFLYTLKSNFHHCHLAN